MSGKIHRCDGEPILSTVFWSDRAKKWNLHSAAISEDSYFGVDTPITYCPYCGEKLKEPEEEDHEMDKTTSRVHT